MFKIQSNIKYYLLKIYDKNNNILRTYNVNNFYQNIYNIEYGGYFVEICYKNNLLLRNFIIYNKDNYIYYLYVFKMYRKVVLYLFDQNYLNLSIEKGNIILWRII